MTDLPTSAPPGLPGAVLPPMTPPGGSSSEPARPKRQGLTSRLLDKLIPSVLLLSLVLNLYLGFILYSQTQGPRESTYTEGDARQRIVILPIKGLVDDSMYQFMRQALQRLEKELPKAIILRVDSGGGYVGPSDRIWNELSQFKKEHPNIPIIASFASTAASGAYYIAAASDVIVMEPTGLTGSIGVIAQAFTMSGLMSKIGVTPETITSTDSVDKDELNPFRDWTDGDRQLLTSILNNAYKQFVDVVYAGRKQIDYGGQRYGLTREEVAGLATGAVFTAVEAKQNKLVDEIGYLHDAIEIAMERAQIATDPRVSIMKASRGMSLSGMLQGSVPEISSPTSQQIRSWLMELSTPEILYRVSVP